MTEEQGSDVSSVMEDTTPQPRALFRNEVELMHSQNKIAALEQAVTDHTAQMEQFRKELDALRTLERTTAADPRVVLGGTNSSRKRSATSSEADAELNRNDRKRRTSTRLTARQLKSEA